LALAISLGALGVSGWQAYENYSFREAIASPSYRTLLEFETRGKILKFAVSIKNTSNFPLKLISAYSWDISDKKNRTPITALIDLKKQNKISPTVLARQN
jgi:hypothetical protein